jgi:hypothetical protein
MFCCDDSNDIFELFSIMEDDQLLTGKRASGECDDDGDDVSSDNEPIQNLSKRGRGQNLGFSARSILPQLLKVYASDELMCSAACTAAKCMYLHESDRKRRFTYTFDMPDSTSALLLSLTVLKGSLATIVWSTIARFDDEYVFEMINVGDDITSSDNSPILLWAMKGLDSDQLSVGPSEVNWVAFRTLQNHMNLHQIGVHAFVRLISKIVINLPNVEREGQVLEPNPASTM